MKLSMKLKMVQHHLVLLPGLDGTGNLFAHFVNNLPSHFTSSVATYPRDQRLNYQQLFPRIREAIPWGKPYTLVAESFSGPLALLFAADQPQDIQAIVLSASFVSNPLPPLFGWTRSLIKDSWLQKMPSPAVLKKYLLGEDCPPVLLEELEQTIRSVHPEVLAHRVRLALDTDAKAALQAFQRPVLCLQARQDKIISPGSLQTITGIKPGVSVQPLDGPHLLLQRKPREAFAAIEKFLDNLKSN